MPFNLCHHGYPRIRSIAAKTRRVLMKRWGFPTYLLKDWYYEVVTLTLLYCSLTPAHAAPLALAWLGTVVLHMHKSTWTQDTVYTNASNLGCRLTQRE